MKTDLIAVTGPIDGAVTEETGLRPESRRVTPEMRLMVLEYYRARVDGDRGLEAVMQSLIAGDLGRATALLRMVQYGGQLGHAGEHVPMIEQLIQGSMCPHHEDIFVPLHGSIIAALAGSSDHCLTGAANRG